MAETMVKKVSLAETRKNLEAYFSSHDLKYVADDAVFTHMSSGDEYVGKEAIGQMLHFMYHVAFDAHAETVNTVITEKHAVLEARFVGKHIGEIADMKPTNKNVDVPFCVMYDIENGYIQKGRVYMLMDLMVRQLSN